RQRGDDGDHESDFRQRGDDGDHENDDLGEFRDDGRDGDRVASDGLYTIRIHLYEHVPQKIQLQASAKFRRGQTIVSESTILLAGDATGLPPDPGATGRATVAGIDSDTDGIRDDVQRYIALAYPDSARTRAALTQTTRAVQS